LALTHRKWRRCVNWRSKISRWRTKANLLASTQHGKIQQSE